MKMIILSLMLSVLANICFAKDKINPDMLVYTRLETKWNIFLLKEFRTFMNNISLDVNPYRYVHTSDIIYGEDSIDQYISEEAHRLVDAISTGTGINMLSTKPELTIKNLGYSIDAIKPSIDPVESNSGNVTLKSVIKLNGIKSFADEISLSFILGQDEKGINLPSPEIKIMNPRVFIAPEIATEFKLDVELVEQKEKISLNFSDGNFEKLSQMIKTNPDLVSIEYDGIEIPEISLQIMGRDISPKIENVLQIIESQKPSLKMILINQLRVLLEKDGAMQVFKHFNGVGFNRNYWGAPSSERMFPFFFGIEDFYVPMKGVLATQINGDFCTTDNFNRNANDCINHRQTHQPTSTITKSDFKYSKNKIYKQLKENKDIKFLASISEDYINKAIVTSIDFSMWESILESMDIEFGDKGVLIKLDTEGKNATVLLDVIYDVGKIPGFVLKKRKLRFPVILQATIKAKDLIVVDDESKKDEAPPKAHIVFTINDVNLDDNILMYGESKYQFPSNVQNVRKLLGLRKTVVRKIKKELFGYKAPNDPENFKKWKGVDLPPILLPEIQDLQLDKMHVESDSYGRLNVLMKGSETIYKHKN